MTVVTVTVADSTPRPTKWEMPSNYEGLRSPIPRGLLTFRGTSAIATLGAGDETSYTVIATLPGGFAYLPKALVLNFTSDDLVAQFNSLAFAFYGGSPTRPVLNMVSPGVLVDRAVTGIQVWTPEAASSKQFINPATPGSSLGLRASDMSAGGSTAGDMSYFMEFYVFDVDQIDKWEVNTPIPTIGHTVF